MPVVTIPTIGSVIELDSDWTFNLHCERRNDALAAKLGIAEQKGWRFNWPDTKHTVTFPKGTVLKVDRIYIRKNSKEFDSVSFWIVETSLVTGQATPVPFKKKGTKAHGRFWAKLVDVNKIDGRWDVDTLPKG